MHFHRQDVVASLQRRRRHNESKEGYFVSVDDGRRSCRIRDRARRHVRPHDFVAIEIQHGAVVTPQVDDQVAVERRSGDGKVLRKYVVMYLLFGSGP